MNLVSGHFKHFTSALFNSFNMLMKLRNTIKFKVTVFLIFIVPIPMIFTGIYFYYILSSAETENMNKELSQLINRVNAHIESNFNMINNTSLIIFSNPVILENLVSDPVKKVSSDIVSRKLKIDAQLNYTVYFNSAWDTNLLKSIFLFKDKDTYYYLSYYNDINTNQNNFKIFRQSENLDLKMPKLIPPTNEDQTIYFIREIKDQFINKAYGRIILGIDEKVLGGLYSDMAQFPNALLYIFDNNGTIFSSIDKDMLGKSIIKELKDFKISTIPTELSINNELYIVASQGISDYNLTSVVAIPKKDVLYKLSGNVNKYMSIVILVIAVSLVFGLFLFSWVKRPLNDLMNNISNVKNGNFSVKMRTYKEAELNQLSELFNNMTDQIQYLFNQVYEKQLLLKESELKFLQSQINPHFLFNVLETISWNARKSNNETIYMMTNSLGKLLRANITLNIKEKITIREELTYVQFYIYLQKARFEDKLETQIKITHQSILDFYLPKLCIQPIVENAIIHGLECKRGKGKLVCSIKTDSNNVIFEIIDDGIGFNTNKIDLNDLDNFEYRREGHVSIGLDNINKRIKLLYGNDYGITIESKINEGTRVLVLLPIDRGEV